ncbi:RNA helicase [Candidozyma auris]|uniref:ATP-dependent RNA helicase SUV3, mitochondrial n=1 Tax=Candidozyma auris TaxID=498019 RepID=A0A2H0ZNB5_CANAR|nr:hypothetical protein QG37_00918 [[Candida] auris]PIS52116.1 hypothetical protein B9J08_003727 [[Candida] auris]PIS54103.1 hypothetical protein CJI97_003801 [[Candida] auris]
MLVTATRTRLLPCSRYLLSLRGGPKVWQARYLATGATSTVQEPPLPKLYKGQDPLEQLRQITQYSLFSVREKLSKRELKFPFEELNHWSQQRIDRKVSLFEQDLYKAYEEFLDDPLKLQEIAKVSMADYFKPRFDKIGAIVYSIHLNMYPNELAKFNNYSKKSEIITDILLKMLWQHHTEASLVSEAADSSQLWDLSAPAEWFPKARRMKRKIVMHVGPTNSGKTYNSLQALAKAKSGYYAGPLRLLAREIYERFQEQGISCNLITGEEVIPSLDDFDNVTEISSGTIEMIPLNKSMDICIIDEIQMIADPLRGSAWTNAVLGVQAKELHLCGEPSAVNLIKELVKNTGDELHIKEYQRLGKLTVEQRAVRDLKHLRKGDCVIVFSKRKILELKCEIENKTDLKVGVIYGALPPEIRSKEASNFNSGKYDVLVASDAVGMGLNLRIKRIVFGSMMKFDGNEMVPLSVSATKQIAGRAGRYSATAGESEGFVTALDSRDMRTLKYQMKQTTEFLPKACIWPPREFWTYYLASFRNPISLADAIKKFDSQASKYRLKDYFYMEFGRQVELLEAIVASNLHTSLTIEDQITLMLAPVNFRGVGPEVIETCVKFFEAISKAEPKTVFDFEFLHLHVLQQRPSVAGSPEQILDYLSALENDHKLVLCYMWLSQRWPTVFVDKESAHEIKTMVEKRISEELLCLRKVSQSRRSSKNWSQKVGSRSPKRRKA